MENAIGRKMFNEIAEGPDSPDLAWHAVVDGKLFAVISFYGEDGIYRRALCGEELGSKYDFIETVPRLAPLTDGANLWYVAVKVATSLMVGPDGEGPPFLGVETMALYRGKPLYVGHEGGHMVSLCYGKEKIWRQRGQLSAFELAGDRLTIRWGSCDTCDPQPPPIVINDLRIFLKLPIHDPPKAGPYR